MAGQSLRVIIDDNEGDIQYSGGQWTLSTLVQWYQATSNYPAFITDTTFASLTFSFEGTSAAFIGNTPMNGFPQFASVSIDDGPATNTSYGSIAPPAYVQWYQTPVLADGKHTIKIGHLAGTAVDMVIVTVGPNTSLAGRKILVDNDDPSITYSGSWAESKSGFDAGTLPDGLPIGNTTQRSTAVGDTMTFRFSGTSVALYGIFSWSSIGLLSATYILDGNNTQSMSYAVTASSPQHLSDDRDAANFLFFEADNLGPGAHSLVVNVTHLENQSYNLDYIVYTPSFTSLSTMPNLTTTVPTSTTASTGTTVKIASTSAASTTVTRSAGTHTNAAPVGPIVGGVVGGILVLVIAAILLLCIRKRRRSEANQSPLIQRPLFGENDTQMSSIVPARNNFGGHASATGSRENITPFALSSPPVTFGVSSISDTKRGGVDMQSGHGVSTPFASSRMRNPTSMDGVSPNLNSPSLQSPPSIASMLGNSSSGLEYMSESVPPAYDALSQHRTSTVSPVRRL